MKKIIVIPGLVMVLVLATSCVGKGELMATEEVSTESVIESIPVETATITTESLGEEVFTFGYLEAIDSYFVTPYSSGVVDEILVSAGDYVEEDQLLYQLQTSDLDLTEDKEFLQQDSSLTNSENSLAIQELSLAQAQGNLQLSELSLSAALENYENTLALFESEISSLSELDAAEDGYEQAQISYDQALLAYESSQLSYNMALASYQDALTNYQLSTDDFDGRRDDLYVVAPISGLVSDVSVQKDIMNAGSSGVMILDDSIMVLDVNIMEKYIREIQVGQSVRLVFDYLEEELDGEVTSISLTANSGYYPVEISIENTDKILVSGMYSEAYIEVGRKDNVMVVDKTVVMTNDNGENYIYILNQEEQRAKMVVVELGLEDGDRVEIIGDISEGDEIITVGQDYLVDGQPVMVAGME